MDWEITRQELMLFHAKHKRMRIVPWHKTVPVETTQVKKDNKDEAFIEYRRHAQNILDSLKENFKKKLLIGSEITLYDPDDQKITAREASRKLIIEKVPGNENKKISILTYLVYWRMCLHYEDWGENSIPDKILLAIIKQIGAPPENGEESNFKVTIDKIDFEDHHLSALLSTLPISPDWDLWGVFTDKNTKKKPTVLDKIQNCIRPVYAAQIKYYGKNNPDGPSHKVVGYSTQLRACYTDTVRNDTTTNFIGERDYYEYCHNPADSKELGFYQAYGIFYDALTFALSGEQNTNGKENADGTPNEKNVFYIAYQIKTSPDRRHFWHITLRPKDQDEANEATLEELWSAWWPIHQQILDWPTLHDSIATEFEQLDFAYARAEIFTDITATREKDDNFSAEESVCKHAYMLFPIRCACYKDKVWAYQKYIINKSEHFKKAVNELKQHHDISSNNNITKLLKKTIGKNTKFELGFEWKDLTKNPTQYRKHISDLNNKKKEEMSENDDIVFRNVYETADKCLQNQRYRRLIDQQLISAKQMFAKHKSEKSMRKSALQSAVAQIFARNFAHNIGSHVAVRATNRMAKERIAELYNFKDANNKTDTTEFKKEAIVNWLDYMGEKLDLFEVARNEFLAEYKLPAKNVMLYRDVILPFCENTLLMDNIAHSESIHYKDHRNNKLKIRVLIDGSEIKASYPNLASYDDCNNISYPDNFPYLVKSNVTRITIDEAFALKEPLGSSDIEICLTNEHTIYSILENLIRNSAKHNKDTLGDNDLVITVNITDGDDGYYTIQIYDNVSKVSQEQLNGFAKSIGDSLITNDGEIQKKSLGIADIKINAHLLKTDADITDKNLKEALMLVYQKDKTEDSSYEEYKVEAPSGTKEYNFGYQFKLCKPKKVVWIGNQITATPDHKKKGLISYHSITAFKPEKNSTKDEPLANYQFAILELDAIRNLKNEKDDKYEWDDFLVKLPHRVLLNATAEEIKGCEAINELKEDGRIQLVEIKLELPDTNKDDWDFNFLKCCWKNWLRKWIKEDETARLIVYFEGNDTKVADWKKGTEKLDFLTVDFFTNTFGGEPITTKTKYVFFDQHANGYMSLTSRDNQNITLDFINDGAYLEFSKSSSDFIRFFYPKNNKDSNTLYLLEAFEAGLNKIVVIDERIGEMLNLKDGTTTKVHLVNGFNAKTNSDYADLANNGNIFIVTKFMEDILNNEHPNYEFISCDADLVIPEFVKDSNPKYDALIIHRTYLNKLFSNENNSDKKKTMHLLYKKFRRVIVVSGGGYPHSIDFKVNFKPYSQLKHCFIQYPSKVSLTNII